MCEVIEAPQKLHFLLFFSLLLQTTKCYYKLLNVHMVKILHFSNWLHTFHRNRFVGLFCDVDCTGSDGITLSSSESLSSDIVRLRAFIFAMCSKNSSTVNVPASSRSLALRIISLSAFDDALSFSRQPCDRTYFAVECYM